MKRFLLCFGLFFVFLVQTPACLGFLDVVGRFFGSIKKDIVESVITARLTSLKPRLLSFEEKGKLVRFGGVVAFIMSLIGFFANIILIIQYTLHHIRRKRKGKHHCDTYFSLSESLKIPFLFCILSLALLGVSFSAFWFGEYLQNLPESIRQLIVNKPEKFNKQ